MKNKKDMMLEIDELWERIISLENVVFNIKVRMRDREIAFHYVDDEIDEVDEGIS